MYPVPVEMVTEDEYRKLLRDLHGRIRSSDPDSAAAAQSLSLIMCPVKVCCEDDLPAYFDIAAQERLPELIARIWRWAADALALLHSNGAAEPSRGLHAVHKLVSISLEQYMVAAKLLVERASKNASTKNLIRTRAVAFAKKFESAGCMAALLSLAGRLHGAGTGAADASLTNELQSRFLTAFKWMMSIWCSEDDINKGTVEPLQGTLSGIHALCAAVQRRQQASLMLVSSPSMLTSTPRQINQLSTAIQLQLSVISMRDLTRIISEVTTLTQGLLTIYRAFLEPQRPQGRADSRGGSGSAKRRHQPLEAAMVVRCAVPCLAVLLDYALRTQLIHAGFGGALSSGEGAAENAAIIHAELCSVLAMLHVCVQLCWPWSEALIPTSVARELHGILHDCLRLQTLHAGKRIAVLILMFLHGVTQEDVVPAVPPYGPPPIPLARVIGALSDCCCREGDLEGQRPTASPHDARMSAFSHLVFFVEGAVRRYMHRDCSSASVSAGAGSMCVGPEATRPDRQASAEDGTASAAHSSDLPPSLQLPDIQRCLAAARLAAASLLSTNADSETRSRLLLQSLGSAAHCSSLACSDSISPDGCAPPIPAPPSVMLAVAVQLLPPLCAAFESVIVSSIKPMREASKVVHLAASSSPAKAATPRERHDAIRGPRQLLMSAVFDGQVGPCYEVLMTFSAAAGGPWMSRGPWDGVGTPSSSSSFGGSSSSQPQAIPLDLVLAMQAAGVPRTLKTIAGVLTKLADGQVGLSAAEQSSDLGVQSVSNITTSAASSLLTSAVACLDTLLQLGAAAAIAAPIGGEGNLPGPLGSGAAVASAAVACGWCADVLDSGLLGAVLHVLWRQQQQGSADPSGVNGKHGGTGTEPGAPSDDKAFFGDAELVGLLSRVQCCLLACASRLGAAAVLPCYTPLRHGASLHVNGSINEASLLNSHLAAFEQEARRVAVGVARYAAASAAEASRAVRLAASSSDGQSEAAILKGFAESKEAQQLAAELGFDVDSGELAATLVTIASASSGQQGGGGGGGSGERGAPPSPTAALAQDILEGMSGLARTLRQAAAASLQEEEAVTETAGCSEPASGAAPAGPADHSPTRNNLYSRGMSAVLSHALGWSSPKKEQPGPGSARGPSLPQRRAVDSLAAAAGSGPSGLAAVSASAGCLRYLCGLLEDEGGGGRSRCHALLQAMGSDWGLMVQASCEEPVAGLCCSLRCRGGGGGDGKKATVAVHLCAGGCGAWYCSQACLEREAKGHAVSCKLMPRLCSAGASLKVTDLEALD